ncbi:50S ribosomal protein L3 [candidate division TM6 bacterium RIFCSPHIGHO2_12_FULL_38_8]|nr:MAG: 50S ribosomal protein L3 [candidate division TM6 bacterium RIFCSPHIGHO2_12_FULL_38_8]
MVNGFWGRKVGMTQVFTQDNKVVPVTAVDGSGWYVSQLKSQDKDGYNAVQVAYVREKLQGKPFQQEWLANKSKHFRWVKEIAVDQLSETFAVGQPFDFSQVVKPQDHVNVVGTTKGCGFAGVMRRHKFSGGVNSHGSMMGRRPGSISFMRSQGKVIKGKRMAGHMGVIRKTVSNLEVVQVIPENNLVLIKGAMAGKPGSLVYVRKNG